MLRNGFDGRTIVSVKQGVVAVAMLSIVFVSLGTLLLFLGQETPSVPLWIAMTFGGFVLLVIGVHILSASILTYLRARRRSASETSAPS